MQDPLCQGQKSATLKVDPIDLVSKFFRLLKNLLYRLHSATMERHASQSLMLQCTTRSSFLTGDSTDLSAHSLVDVLSGRQKYRDLDLASKEMKKKLGRELACQMQQFLKDKSKVA